MKRENIMRLETVYVGMEREKEWVKAVYCGNCVIININFRVPVGMQDQEEDVSEDLSEDVSDIAEW